MLDTRVHCFTVSCLSALIYDSFDTDRAENPVATVLATTQLLIWCVKFTSSPRQTFTPPMQLRWHSSHASWTFQSPLLSQWPEVPLISPCSTSDPFCTYMHCKKVHTSIVVPQYVDLLEFQKHATSSDKSLLWVSLTFKIMHPIRISPQHLSSTDHCTSSLHSSIIDQVSSQNVSYIQKQGIFSDHAAWYNHITSQQMACSIILHTKYGIGCMRPPVGGRWSSREGWSGEREDMKGKLAPSIKGRKQWNGNSGGWKNKLEHSGDGGSVKSKIYLQ